MENQISKQKTIKLVEDCVSSIFTKQDVLTLLNGIHEVSGVKIEKVKERISSVLHKHRVSCSRFSENEGNHVLVDASEIEFSINGNVIEASNILFNEERFFEILDEALEGPLE